MVFKSDKQRKKVMAMMRGGTKSAVSPQIIRESSILKPRFRAQFIKDRKSGLTLRQTAKKLAQRAIKRGRLERKKRVTEIIKKFKLKGTINGEDLGILNVRSRTKKLAIQQGIKEAKLDARFSPGVKIKVRVIK